MASVIDAMLLATIVGLFKEKGNLSNVTSLNERITAEGDGYVSEISRVVVTGKDASGIERVYDTVVKASLPTQTIRINVPITMMFERELLFFDRIIPIYEDVQNTISIKDKLNFPKKYFSSDEYLKEYIVMENLKSNGFRNADNKKSLDLSHGSLVVRTLAKFHALSFIYREREPNDYLTVTNQLTDNFMVDGTDFKASGIHKYAKLVFDKFVGCLHNPEHKNKVLKASGSNFSEALQELLGNGTTKVISHSDYWINNILFKYENNVPSEAVIIDYQMVRHASIVNDLLSFLGTCYELELRRNHFWDLIDVYYESLEDFLKMSGYEIEDFCTREQFDKELRERSFFGVAMGIFMIPFYDSEVPSIQILFSGDLPDSFNIVSPKFEKLANDLIEDYVSWNLL